MLGIVPVTGLTALNRTDPNRVLKRAVEKSTIIESNVGEASALWVQRSFLWCSGV